MQRFPDVGVFGDLDGVNESDCNGCAFFIAENN